MYEGFLIGYFRTKFLPNSWQSAEKTNSRSTFYFESVRISFPSFLALVLLSIVSNVTDEDIIA